MRVGGYSPNREGTRSIIFWKDPGLSTGVSACWRTGEAPVAGRVEAVRWVESERVLEVLLNSLHCLEGPELLS